MNPCLIAGIPLCASPASPAAIVERTVLAAAGRTRILGEDCTGPSAPSFGGDSFGSIEKRAEGPREILAGNGTPACRGVDVNASCRLPGRWILPNVVASS